MMSKIDVQMSSLKNRRSDEVFFKTSRAGDRDLSKLKLFTSTSFGFVIS